MKTMTVLRIRLALRVALATVLTLGLGSCMAMLLFPVTTDGNTTEGSWSLIIGIAVWALAGTVGALEGFLFWKKVKKDNPGIVGFVLSEALDAEEGGAMRAIGKRQARLLFVLTGVALLAVVFALWRAALRGQPPDEMAGREPRTGSASDELPPHPTWRSRAWGKEITKCKMRMHRLWLEVIALAQTSRAPNVPGLLAELRDGGKGKLLVCQGTHPYIFNPDIDLWRKAFIPEGELAEQLGRETAIVCPNPTHRPLDKNRPSWLAITLGRRQIAIETLPWWAKNGKTLSGNDRVSRTASTPAGGGGSR